MVLYLTPSRRATAIASETRRAPIPPETPRLPQRASSPSTFMAIPEVSRETRSIEGHCDVARVAFAATSRTRRRRVFQKGNTLGAARDALAAEAVVASIRPRRVRFFSDVSVRAFRTRSSSLGAIGCVSSARGASRARDRVRTPGAKFFLVDFFFSRFFFSRLVNTRSRRNLDRGRDARSRGHPRARIGRRCVRDATEHSLSRGSRRARARVAVEAAAAPPDRRVTRPRIPRTSLSREALQVFFLRLVFVFFSHKKPPPRSARSRLEKAHEGDEVDGVGG